VTTPRAPLIVNELFETDCVPSDTLLVGALSVIPPAVRSKVAGVAAPAGRAVTTASVANMLTTGKSLRIE
jgi:hypothetical protein